MSFDRRTFLTAAGAAGLGAATLASSQSKAQASTAPVIDVHTHMFSPGWMEVARNSSDKDFYLGTGDMEGGIIYRGA